MSVVADQLPTGAPTRAAGRARLPGLDRLRAVALVLMLVHHVSGWVSGVDARSFLPGWRQFAVTDVAAPAFAVAAGMALHLLLARGVGSVEVLRRYGLLVLAGVALDTVVFREPEAFGVLECLGSAALLAYACARLLGPRSLAVVAAALLLSDAALAGVTAGWDRSTLAWHVLRGTFPLGIYTGFVVVGVLAGRSLRGRDRPGAATAVAFGLTATCVVLAAAGYPPDRYPATVAYVVPGLAGTAWLYAALAAWRPRRGSALGSAVHVAGCHTLGAYVAHHVVLLGVRARPLDLPPAGAVVVAVVLAATTIAAVAALPPLPWSPRKGRVRGSPVVAGQAVADAFSSSSSASASPPAMPSIPGTVSLHASSPKSS